MNTSFEAVPKHRYVPLAVLRAQILDAAIKILADGRQVTMATIRDCGVRGTQSRIYAIRKNLVDSGELPPEAGRVYQKRLAPNGKASLPPPPPPKVNINANKPMSHTEVSVRMYGVKRLRRQYRKKDRS